MIILCTPLKWSLFIMDWFNKSPLTVPSHICLTFTLICVLHLHMQCHMSVSRSILMHHAVSYVCVSHLHSSLMHYMQSLASSLYSSQHLLPSQAMMKLSSAFGANCSMDQVFILLFELSITLKGWMPNFWIHAQHWFPTDYCPPNPPVHGQGEASLTNRYHLTHFKCCSTHPSGRKFAITISPS